jgi:hypothetical protein
MCDWSEEIDPFQLPVTQGSFDLLIKEWGIPLLFLEFIGGFNTRAHKFSVCLGNGHDAKGRSLCNKVDAVPISNIGAQNSASLQRTILEANILPCGD